MYFKKSFGSPSFKLKPKTEIKINDLMLFFKIPTVIKYKSAVKNNSKRELSSEYSFFVNFELLLNVIKTVKRVRIKPALVSPIFDKSVVIESERWSFGKLNSP